jgi:hypothetical protein
MSDSKRKKNENNKNRGAKNREGIEGETRRGKEGCRLIVNSREGSYITDLDCRGRTKKSDKEAKE